VPRGLLEIPSGGLARRRKEILVTGDFDSSFVCTRCGCSPETTTEQVTDSIIPLLLTRSRLRSVPVEDGWTTIEGREETVRICPGCLKAASGASP
jgi:hypothetical protein